VAEAPAVTPAVTAGPLAGRVALVTGGGRGIGAGITAGLARAGAAVAFTYRRDRASADELAGRLTDEGAAVLAVEASVDDPAASARAVDAVVGEYGGLDTVVSNAGVASRGLPVAETTAEEVSWLLAVHAVGPHQLIRAALPHLRAHERSDVVVISSIAVGDSWHANGAPYAMAKAAAEAMAHVLAREERANGVRVNIVAPGLVDTEMGRRLVRATQDVTDIRTLDAASPFGRVCTPEDVAAVVRSLVDPACAYVTDQRVVVDGGTF
jgi:NAD(P)-dependent dehydrogenase (short-subunit alcohol dehydrogenase family)